MKALTYHGPGDIHYEEVADPTPHDLDGAVVKISLCSICGSDLHIYHGHGFSSDIGYTVGHEAVGEVVEVGSSVRKFKIGDRVLVPGSTGCSSCDFCRRGLVGLCSNGMSGCYGLSYRLQGSQAEAVAVPAADTGLWHIPDAISDEQAILLTDGLATGWNGAVRADIQPGQTIAVIGLGPVGLSCVMSAIVMGASVVYAIDPVESRRAVAEKLGAIPIHGEDAVAQVHDLTRGRRVDVVLEAVGGQSTLPMAISLATVGGTVSVVGVHQARSIEFPMALAQAKSLAFIVSLTSVQAQLPALTPLVASGRLKPELLVSHRVGLSDGVDAFRRFADREDGVLKIVLDPSK